MACDSLSYPICEDCTFEANMADAGGAVSAMETSGPSFVNCTFSGNTARSSGGGCHVWRAGLTLTGCSFTGNSAAVFGGAVYVSQSSPQIHECLFANNSVRGPGSFNAGGALFCESGCAPQITGTRFIGNTVEGPATFRSGGAVSFKYGCAPSFQGCTFSGNRVLGQGGGGAVSSNMSSTATFEDCRFCDNASPDWGGALDAWDGAARLERCTLVENAGQSAGGIALEEHSAGELVNTIIAFGSQGPAVACDALSSCLLSCCDLYGNAGGDWIGVIAGQLGVNGNLCADPLFCGAQNIELPYSVNEDSPCAPEFNPECGLIGAYPVGCGYAAVRSEDPRRPPRPSLELIAIVPNPFGGSARIDYRIGTGAGSPVTLEVYDAAGRLVRALAPVTQAPGEHSLTWDGRGTDGAPLAGGVYFLTLAGEEHQAVRRVVVMH